MESKPSLADKTVLVTGATSGIGWEASVSFAHMGARLIMVGRDASKTAQKVEEVRQRSGSRTVDSLLCDFSSQAQVRRLAQEFRDRYDKLHVLVNNAGTVFTKRTVTAYGIESTFAVNYLGPFLLTNLLLDVLKASAPARVIIVSSSGHFSGTMDFNDLGFEHGYQIMRAYGRSKLAAVLFTRELAKRLKGTDVTVNALHPGAVGTSIWDRAPGYTRPFFSLAKRLFMISPAAGAETIVYLATSLEVEGETGLYFEKNRPKFPSRLAQDDAVAQRLWDESARLVKLPA
ncbi:MAG TPA: SDR family oxidoreductase [Candidatus Dormibacteraeota bacterium]|nr:SDR family oxidoreductase [Candidatus Dormibacteraeota bacterium]